MIEPPTDQRDDPSDLWVDETLRVWFEIAPVDATFAGLHEHDAAMPDPSPEGCAKARVRLERQLEGRPEPTTGRDGSADGSATPDSADLATIRFSRLDADLVSDALAVRLWELESRWMTQNPSVHVGEAAFGLMSLVLPQHGGAEPDRLAALSDRMRSLPTFFRGATDSLERAPTAWTDRALHECRGMRSFLAEGLQHTAFDDDEAAAIALEAVSSFEDFLSLELSSRPRDRVGCGAEALELLVARGHRLDRTPTEIAQYARDELERTAMWVREHARDFGLADPDELGPALRARHPVPDAYYTAYTTVWAEMKRLAEARDLVTWPDFPIRYEPRPAWARTSAPDLYFLFYRSPAAFHRPDVHTYMVAPLPGGSEAEREAFLQANNDSVIKLNHVVHHGGIGHHVQNWHAFRSPLRMGRISAVDCASRIAMFSGGTMAEGWACYATDLMAEAGGLTELEQFAEHAGRMRMAARAIVDVGIHLEEMDLAQAAAFYRTHAGMSGPAAHAEAVKNSMFPGAALMYLIGTDLIHELRADLISIQGDDFDLCAFHDAFLSWGSIPVAVIADEMRRRAHARLPLGAHDPIPTAVGGESRS